MTELAAELRDQTRWAHEQAENSVFVRSLVQGLLPLNDYTALVAQHHAIYQALETAGRQWPDDPIAGPFVFAELLRVPSLERDLRQLLGTRWAEAAAALVQPATLRYVERISEVCPDSAGCFIAHHYVRYLGDLSGGQIIRRGLVQTFGQAALSASSFYDFEAVEKVKPFRDQYRELLNGAQLSAAGQRELIAEALTAFELNLAVFEDLARVSTRGVGREGKEVRPTRPVRH